MREAYRSPGCAAVLSFFVAGLGHIYNGDVALGVGVFFCMGILGYLALVASPLFAFVALALWVWNICSAYRRTWAHNGSRTPDWEMRRTGSPPSSLDECGTPPKAEDIPTIRRRR